MLFNVHLNIAVAQVHFAFARTAQHHFNARQKLHGLKRLYNVIVRTELKPEHAVDLLGFRRQHYNRNTAVLANLAANVHSAFFGHHEIKNNKVRLFAVEFFNRLFAVKCRNALESLVSEVDAECFVNDMLIIANQYLLFD